MAHSSLAYKIRELWSQWKYIIIIIIIIIKAGQNRNIKTVDAFFEHVEKFK